MKGIASIFNPLLVPHFSLTDRSDCHILHRCNFFFVTGFKFAVIQTEMPAFIYKMVVFLQCFQVVWEIHQNSFFFLALCLFKKK